MFVETRTDGRWVSACEKRSNPFVGWPHEPEYILEEIDIKRNYALFSVLAGVRATGRDDLVMIAARDADDMLAPSWLTLSELVEYNSLGSTVTEEYRVPPEIAAEFVETGRLPDDFRQADYPEPDSSWETVELEIPVGEAVLLNDLIGGSLVETPFHQSIGESLRGCNAGGIMS